MTQENKELLLKDLCTRLPYEVKVCCNNTVYNIDAYTKSAFMLAEPLKPDVCIVAYIEEVKPYLFPLSSMTDEQKEEYHYNCNVGLNRWGNEVYYDCVESIDWLNTHHFDYTGLIEKGLALDATGLNIY